MSNPISPSQFQQSAGEDWRVIGDGGCAFFATESLAAGAGFAQDVASLPGVEPHRPDLDLRHDGVSVRVVSVSPENYGMTDDDAALAREISRIAREHGLRPDPTRIQSVLIIPGAKTPAEVMPFWQAVLAYERRPDSPEEDLIDPQWRGPGLWFEQMDELRADGGGAVHVAVWVPVEQAEARVQAALAAGGRMVRDDFAPSWWTLADAYGNECDVSSIGSRE